MQAAHIHLLQTPIKEVRLLPDSTTEIDISY
jgi:hypothetical protein